MNAWSAGTVSFTSDRAGNLDIYIIDTNGENLINLTNHPADDYSPTWSPDGRSMAYISERDGNPEIYVMDLNTKEQRRLTEHKATDIDPAWSPDAQLRSRLTKRATMPRTRTSTRWMSTVRRLNV